MATSKGSFSFTRTVGIETRVSPVYRPEVVVSSAAPPGLRTGEGQNQASCTV
jgi:hypothetical protein